MTITTTRRRSAAILAAALLLLGTACGSDESESGPTVLAADAEVDGSSQAELLGDYTTAWMTAPVDESFLADVANCDNAGTSPDGVYYAPSWVEPGDGSTSCTMQADQALFLNAAGLVCVEEGEDTADVECLESLWDLTSSSVTINGESVDMAERTVDTDVLSVELADENIFELPAAEYPTIVRGEVVVVEDLPVGEHTVVLAGDFGDGEFAGSLTITLTVED